ncbi:MAG: 3-hydroxyacyl-CoA dehydrogenase family protein [Clostridia bacterium]|nr:3-hydroxyacyl-CoA dehydrogenase family protein [Clostridia bacterium]
MDRDGIKKVAIAGAGIMGSSIAQIFARNGFQVTLYDIEAEFLRRSKNLIALNQTALVEAGELSEAESNKVKTLIDHTLEITAFKDADLVIEAIVEQMDEKHALWSKISELVAKDTILTSNTSGLSISKIAEAVSHPERFCGMHWINPPHIIPLVEVICGEKTSRETADKVFQIAAFVGKTPILVKKDAPGFALNRIQFAVLREAMHIVEEGIADMEDVDKVLKYGLGMRYACLGPFEVADLGGLDTFYRISSYLFQDLSAATEVPDILKSLVNQGACGVKSGKGFYDYGNGRDAEVISKRDADFLKIAKCLYCVESD